MLSHSGSGLAGTGVPEGSFNFRDLGGWPTASGGRTREGLVYRCGELDGLTRTGWRQLAGLGITDIYDLRGDSEIRGQAPAVAGITLHRVPLWGSDAPGETLADRVFAEGAGDPVTRYARAKAESYVRMTDLYAGGFGTVISRLAQSPGRPALFHCASGKDRTGLLAALILLLAGVGERDVLADYLASRAGTPASRRERYLPKLRALGGDEAAFAPVYAAHPPALLAALRHIEAHWGSVADYLVTAGNVARDDIGALRRRLVAPPPALS